MLDAEIAKVLEEYRLHFPEDAATVDDLQNLLSIRADVTCRKEFRGHVTCGAIVVDPHGKLLMIHHRTLDKWLFPGGHLEKGDATIRDGALREVSEETGVPISALLGFGNWLDQTPVQIDCHPIPENLSKSEPAHRHFDFRYVFRGSHADLSLQLDEVTDCTWVEARKAPQSVYERLVRFVL